MSRFRQKMSFRSRDSRAPAVRRRTAGDRQLFQPRRSVQAGGQHPAGKELRRGWRWPTRPSLACRLGLSCTRCSRLVFALNARWLRDAVHFPPPFGTALKACTNSGRNTSSVKRHARHMLGNEPVPEGLSDAVFRRWDHAASAGCPWDRVGGPGASHDLQHEPRRAQRDFRDPVPVTLHRSRGLAFPCDASGQVNLDALSDRGRNNYLFARAMVGREFSTPDVRIA
jgi:hypothetical protein